MIQLEKDLEEALRAAGRPPVIPRDVSDVTVTSSARDDVMLPPVAPPPVARKRPPIKDLSAENLSDVSGESDLSSPELSPGKFRFLHFRPRS